MVGCAKNPQAPAKVSGQVTYKGAPVPAGNIVFHSEDKGSYNCALGTDGTYEIVDIPTGELIVTVDNEFLNPKTRPPDYGGGKGAALYAERVAAERKAGMMIKGPEASGQYVKIPSKYHSSKTSPLSVTVEKGRQIKNFELTD
jgi:hypothetical protein